MSYTMKSTFFDKIKRFSFVGIATIFPLSITGYLIYFLFHLTDSIMGIHVNGFLTDAFGFNIPRLGLLLVIAIIVATGYVSTHWMGDRFLPLIDRKLFNLPVVKKNLSFCRAVVGFSVYGKKILEQVVLVQYPETVSSSLEFVTSQNLATFDETQESNNRSSQT
ncbi:MAG: DUF502 domain-containing protein [Chitinivibrionales bacterium]